MKMGAYSLMHNSSLSTYVPFPTVTVKVFPAPLNCLPEALLTHSHWAPFPDKGKHQTNKLPWKYIHTPLYPLFSSKGCYCVIQL